MEAVAIDVTHQKHWKFIGYSESIQILETFLKEKLYKNQQCNQACKSLPFNQPQERTFPGNMRIS